MLNLEKISFSELNEEDKNLLIYESYRGLALFASKVFEGQALFDYSEEHWKLYEGGIWVPDLENQFYKSVEHQLLSVINPLINEINDEMAKADQIDEDNVKFLKNKKTKAYEQKEKINNPAALSKILGRMASELNTSLPKFDTSISKVCLENGIFDFDTAGLIRHEPQFLFTKKLPFQYNPDAKAPKWEAFISLIMRDRKDVCKYLQKIFGYCLTGYNSLQSLIFFHGGGGNGKTIVISILRELLGDQAGGYFFQFNTEQLLGKQRTGDTTKPYTLAQLHGMRVICGTEVPSGMVLDAAMVKDLTGGDAIVARSPGGKPFNYLPIFKVLLYGNHFPTLKDTDDGIRRRIKLVKFEYSFRKEGASIIKERDEVMAEFRNEMPGIFNWAVEGYMLYKKEGLSEPKFVEDATQNYFNEEDIIEMFLEDVCIKQPGSQTRANDLWQALQKWDKIRQYVGSRNQFYRDLEAKGFIKRMDPHLKQNVITGLQLKQEEKTQQPSIETQQNLMPETKEDCPF